MKKPVKMTMVSAPKTDQERVSIRKIENGFIVSKSTYNKSSCYKDCEYFTPTKPDLGIAKPKK